MITLKSKRAQEGGTNMYMISLIVALVILVLIIYSFVTNLGGVRDKWNQFVGGSSNLDDIKSACTLACNSGESNNYNDYMRDVTFSDGFKTKATCKQLESTTGACEDASGKIIAGVTAKSDCEGVSGSWNEGNRCYQIGTNGALAPLNFGNSFTVDMCKNNPKTYKYFETGVCLIDLKPVETADTKAKCEGQGVWVLNKEAAVITTACTNPQVI